MAIYPYVCPVCNREEEVWQKYSDPAPTCLHEGQGEVPMNRQIGSGTDFILKGTGWYGKGVTPFRGVLSRKAKKNK